MFIKKIPCTNKTGDHEIVNNLDADQKDYRYVCVHCGEKFAIISKTNLLKLHTIAKAEDDTDKKISK